MVVQAQADISEFRQVNHVSSPIDNPRLYEEEDSQIQPNEDSYRRSSQIEHDKVRQFHATISESKNGGESGPGFGKLLEESPQLKSLNRLNI